LQGRFGWATLPTSQREGDLVATVLAVGHQDSETIMRRTLLALLLSAGLIAACGKKDPAPATPPETAAPAADPTASDGPKDPAVAPDKGDEAGQPRRTIEPADAPADEPAAVDPTDPTGEPDEATEGDTPDDAPTHAQGGDEGDMLMAAAKLTPGPAVDLGEGAASAEALAYLPDNTAAAFVVASPTKLLGAFGYDALRPLMAEGSKELIEATGYDLFDPAVWAELGVDLSGPAGGAAIASEKEPYVIFLTIGDRAKLDAALAAISEKGKRPFKTDKVGEAEIISTEGYDRNVIVIRGKSLLIVGVDRNAGAMALAKQVAAQDKASSLVQAVEFTAAVKPIDGAEDVLGWGNFGLGLRMSMAFQSQYGGDRAEKQAEMIEKVFGGMGGFAMGGFVKERALEVTAFMPLAKDAMIGRLVKNIEGLPVAFTASSDAPLLGMAVRFDPKVVVEMMEMSLAAEGASLDEVRAAAKEMGGVDLDTDVFGVFNGQASFVLLGELGGMDYDDFDVSKLGGALVVGLSNAEGLKKLFALGAKMGDDLPPGMKIDESGSMELPLPTGQRVHVSIAGDHLVATTNAALAKRVAAGDTSASFIDKVAHPGLKAALSRPNQAGWFVMPQRLMALWMLGYSEPMTEEAEVTAMIGDGPTEAKKSKELIAKEKEIAELKERIDVASKASREAMNKAADALFTQLGTLVESVEVTDGGLAIHAGEYLGGTPAELMAAIVKMAEAVESRRGADNAMYEKLFELENEARKLELEADMAEENK